MSTSDLPRDIRDVLERFRFDRATFEALRERFRRGEIGGDADRISEAVEPMPAGAWTSLPPRGSAERARLEALGREAIAAGRVAVVVLNGGMATRFGGVVKAAVPVLDGRSFLDLKLADVGAGGAGRAWTLLMNSFATHDATLALLREARPAGPVRTFTQSVMPRLDEAGELFRDGAGRPSLAAPGHGDLSSALRASEAFAELRRAGGDIVMMANVDNLGATLDPAVVGAHLDLGGEMTVELVDKDPGDAGGAPALVAGRPQIVEGFRFPAAFDQSTIPVFNTNTFVFDAKAFDRDHELTWFAVRKKVDGLPAVQLERLAGELSALLETRYLLVPRRGAESRFLPAKDPEELGRRLPEIREALTSRGVIPA